MSLIDNVKQLETKQKIMLVALIGALGLVFYLTYTTFFAGDSGSSIPAPAAAPEVQQPVITQASFPSENAASVAPAAPQAAMPMAANNAASNNLEVGQPTPPTPEDLALLAQSQQMQQQYVQLVNEYQLAQLQQKLAQVDSQIAASKLTTTKSLVELKKLQPDLGGLSAARDNTASFSTTTQQVGFQALYVGQVSGRWQAMLQYNGQYYQVFMGMRLPDGSTVTQINGRGVVLTKNGTQTFLPISKSLD